MKQRILALSYYLENPINRIIIAFFGGILLSLSLPFIGLSFLAWIALVPLFLLIASSHSFKNLFLEAFVFGLIYNLISFFWLLSLHPLTWQGLSEAESFLVTSLAWLLPSIFHSLIIAAYALVAKLVIHFTTGRFSLINIVLLSFLWVTFQYKILTGIPGLAIFSVPINLLAYSQYKLSSLIQIVSLIGSIGLELCIVLVNILFCRILFNKLIDKVNYNPRSTDYRFKNIVSLSTIIVVFICLFSFGFNQSKNYGEMLSYGIVQANLSGKEIRGKDLNPLDVFKRHADLSKDIADRNDLIIWPEGSVASTKRFWVDKKSAELVNELHTLIFGTYFGDAESRTFNSIQVLNKSEGEIFSKFYHKRHLVPFGEYTPFMKIFPKSLQLLAQSVVGEGFSEGPKDQGAVETTYGKIGFTVCFELLFPEMIRKEVLSGAEYLINLNDLSWFKGEMVKKQFLAVAVMRAIENRRDLILAGNVGYSAHIDSLGNIKEISQPSHKATLEGVITTNNKVSIFSRYGW